MNSVQKVTLVAGGIELTFEDASTVELEAEDALEISKWISLYAVELKQMGGIEKRTSALSKFYIEED